MIDLNISTYQDEVNIYTNVYPFCIVTVGSSMQNTVHRPAGISDYQLLYTLEGSGIGLVDGEETDITKNTILLLPPLTPHEYYNSSGKWKTMWITFNGNAAEDFLGRNTVFCEWNGEHSFEELYQDIFCAKKNFKLKECSILLYKLLLDFCEFSDKRAKSNLNVRNRLYPAIKYMYEHYCEDINICLLASMINVTQSHFCRMFKEFTGVRPTEYIMGMRIAQAKMIMANVPDMSVIDVGIKVGYQSESYFIKRFREAEGITPNAFKKNITYNL